MDGKMMMAAAAMGMGYSGMPGITAITNYGPGEKNFMRCSRAYRPGNNQRKIRKLRRKSGKHI